MNKYQEAYNDIELTCLCLDSAERAKEYLSPIIELVKKATPKKPILEYVVDGYYYRCSECGKLILDDVTANSVSGDSLKEDCSYCSRCGAKVDWSDT